MVAKVYNEGNAECQHVYIYGNIKNIGFTCPAKISQTRICQICGREEEVVTTYVEKYDKKRYEEIKERFTTKD